MKATIQVKISVTDDENSIYEVKKQSNFVNPDGSKDIIYCQLFDLINSVMYDVVETSGHDIDFFI